jgi:hypothetical protein
MKIGSKVVCIDGVFCDEVKVLYDQLPIKDEGYTVRGLPLNRDYGKSGTEEAVPGILLEELKNRDDPWAPGKELAFNQLRFREVEEASATKEEFAEIGHGQETREFQYD